MSNYHVASTPGPVTAPPKEQRFPFDWPAFGVTPNAEPALLLWPEAGAQTGPARLRITVALDDREDKGVEAVLGESGDVVGRFDLRSADALGTYEVRLSETDAGFAQREGVRLRLSRGSAPLYLFSGTGGELPDSLRPHLYYPQPSGDRWGEFYARLCSLGSLEPFGWQEGCVLDGLIDLHAVRPELGAEAAARAHLKYFISEDGGLTYEDPRGEPCDGRLFGIEATLPFAALARLTPDHPLLSLVNAFWKERAGTHGSATDGKITTAEGMYTVAYPMALMAQARRKEGRLAASAVNELRQRRERLVHEGDIYLRFNALTGERTFKNWSRGVAWYLLGMVKTLALLSDRTDIGDLREEFGRAALWAMNLQKEGLWRCFLDDPTTQSETSGSAGIAAALALGARHGLLEAEARLAAARTLAALTSYLTPDGFLSGAAPSNKGGEALQRSPHRAIKKSAMGLTAVLIAALN